MKGEDILNEVRFLINDHNFTRYNEINRAYRKIAHKAPHSWLKEETEQLLKFESGTNEYTVNITGIRRITGLWIYGVNTGDQRWNYVEEVDDKLFEIKRDMFINLDGEDREGMPEYFKILSVQNNVLKFKFIPTPDEDMNGRINYIKEVSEISRDTVPEMPTAYHDLIAQLAAGYILRATGDKIGDTYVAEAEKSVVNLVNDAEANRTKDIDRPARRYLRSGYNRYGSYGRYPRRWRYYR
jgi:hypothetical protein